MPSSPPWNLPPSFTVESTLSSPWFLSDSPPSCQGAALAHLDFLPPHDLVIWTDGPVPFSFGKGGSGVSANCSLCETEATLSFLAGIVCSSFSADSMTFLLVSAAPTSLPFLFSSLTLALFSPPSFVIPQSLWHIWLDVFPFLLCYQTNWVLRHSFLTGNNAADVLARSGALPMPSTIPCSFSAFISRIHSSLFSDWRRTVSSKFFDTQVPSISAEKLALLHHACCTLSRLCCNGHSLLLSSFLIRIGRTENSSGSACEHPSQDISHVILHCLATDSLRCLFFGDSLYLYDL